ncbi:MAG: ABC-F family ATP-binding cassette domain-containing protein [Bacteroidales bacterium]|jgi:ATP-binding cassette subfamily F protein uup|nr:ABC-F family ATP-binding cassette domain-containing protein [Bacteroidales bacterium]
MAENLLNVENLSKSFGEKTLFNDVNFGINRGQKIALVAKNGSGKTTLLNILNKKEEADSGIVSYKKDIRIAFLQQEPFFPQNTKVIDYVLSHKTSLDEWENETRVKEVLDKLKIKDVFQDLSSLSGGERKKVALSKILLEDCDLMILDEPTNHLDIEIIEWLEEFLSKQRLTLFMVTHDRYFINNICSDIYELDEETIFKYKGNYNTFCQYKEKRLEIREAEIEKAKNIYRKELLWFRRMPQARGTKAKARIDNFYAIKQKASLKPEEQLKELSTKVDRIGGKILEIHNISKSFGEKKIIDDFTYIFKRGEKIGIVGGNGQGKSTLLNILCNEEKKDSGTISLGQTIKIGYYKQEGLTQKGDARVIDIIKEVAENIELSNGTTLSASVFLSYFGFSPSVQYNYYSLLSGGEKRKLYLLKTLIANCNFLILDEPTNDLDIYNLNILENFLKQYKGCLIIVSHDRSFLDGIVDHLFVFQGKGKIKDFMGNYQQYREEKQVILSEKNEENKDLKEKNQKIKTPQKVKLSFNEQKELLFLEEEIPKLTEEKNIIEQKLSKGEFANDEIASLSIRHKEISEELEQKEMRWLILSEKQ